MTWPIRLKVARKLRGYVMNHSPLKYSTIRFMDHRGPLRKKQLQTGQTIYISRSLLEDRANWNRVYYLDQDSINL
jgi:hypothetical protein